MLTDIGVQACSVMGGFQWELGRMLAVFFIIGVFILLGAAFCVLVIWYDRGRG